MLCGSRICWIGRFGDHVTFTPFVPGQLLVAQVCWREKDASGLKHRKIEFVLFPYAEPKERSFLLNVAAPTLVVGLRNSVLLGGPRTRCYMKSSSRLQGCDVDFMA